MGLLFADRLDDVGRVRQALDEAGFTGENVQDVIGKEGFGFLGRGELGPLPRRTQGASRLETLIRLFLCGVLVALAAAERALDPLTVAPRRGRMVPAAGELGPPLRNRLAGADRSMGRRHGL